MCSVADVGVVVVEVVVRIKGAIVVAVVVAIAMRKHYATHAEDSMGVVYTEERQCGTEEGGRLDKT